MKYKEYPIVGHTAGEIAGAFYHPPYFYYLIASLIAIHESLLFVTAFFTLLHTFSILTIYYIGKTQFNKHVGSLPHSFTQYLQTKYPKVQRYFLLLQPFQFFYYL